MQSSKLSDLHLFLYSTMSMVYERIYYTSDSEDTCENTDKDALENCAQQICIRFLFWYGEHTFMKEPK
jgi:hypothetical protein